MQGKTDPIEELRTLTSYLASMRASLSSLQKEQLDGVTLPVTSVKSAKDGMVNDPSAVWGPCHPGSTRTERSLRELASAMLEVVERLEDLRGRLKTA